MFCVEKSVCTSSLFCPKWSEYFDKSRCESDCPESECSVLRKHVQVQSVLNGVAIYKNRCV